MGRDENSKGTGVCLTHIFTQRSTRSHRSERYLATPSNILLIRTIWNIFFFNSRLINALGFAFKLIYIVKEFKNYFEISNSWYQFALLKIFNKHDKRSKRFTCIISDSVIKWIMSENCEKEFPGIMEPCVRAQSDGNLLNIHNIPDNFVGNFALRVTNYFHPLLCLWFMALHIITCEIKNIR